MAQAQLDNQLKHRTEELALTNKCQEVKIHLEELTIKLKKVESALAFLSQKLTTHTKQITIELALITEILTLIQNDRLKELSNLSLTDQLADID